MNRLKNILSKISKLNDVKLTRQSNNFDALRLLAASLVLIFHAPTILGVTYKIWDPFKHVLGLSMGSFSVLTFFIISGFLITMSWERKKNVLDFFIARILRIYPAVIVVVLLSVFVLGAILTTENLTDYLTHNLTQKYLQNVSLFRMYYYLPEVFNTNPISSINGSLWTLPYEFTCYLFVGILGLLTILNKKIIALLLFVFLLIIELFFPTEVRTLVIPIIGIDFKTFYTLFLYFISGSMFYILKQHIKFNIVIAIIAVLIIYGSIDTFIFNIISAILLPYIILTIAFFKPLPFKKIAKHGDFSYGLYLYAFPVQQLVVFIFGENISLVLMIILSFLFSLPLAILSWKLIENPALQLRKKLYKIFP
ncbi:MAG: acyltransferase family protein [Vicingaceae bacterium]